MRNLFANDRVLVKVGDITAETTDAIVNAANWTLLGGGGVDGAIHDKGGAAILEECKKIRKEEYPNGLPTGKAVMTSGGKLKAKYVIHTVGPIYGQNRGRDAELLADCYKNSLAIAEANNLETIAFPSISTGAFYFPKPEAAAVSSVAIKGFLEQNVRVKKINLVFFSPRDADIFLKHQKF
jgi:O-acetyl-ADP-ribose deacetylase